MKNSLKFASLFSMISIMLLFAFTSVNNKKRIVIDAGHGGHDTGAMVDKITESNINFAIAKKVKAYGNDSNLEIILLRNDDKFLSLTDRKKKLKQMKADAFISLHSNYAIDKNLNGMDFMISENSHKRESIDLVTKIASSIIFEKGPGSTVNVKNVTPFLMKDLDIPAVTIEMGYLSNKADLEYLTSSSGQNHIAQKIVEGLIK